MVKSSVIDSVREKVDRLIADNRRLGNDYEKVSDQRDKLKVENRNLTEQIAKLEKRVAILELKESVAGESEDTRIARARINRLMREVDKCIALLNK